MSGLWEVAALAAAALGVATWAAVVLLAPRASGAADPARRARQTRAWLLAPLWVTGLLLATATLPGAAGLVLADLDHCLQHVIGHHHHLCWAHPPHRSGHLLGWLVPGALAAGVALRLGPRAWRVWRTHRMTAALVRLSRPSDLGPDVRLLDQDAPVAVAVGWRRPVVLLSTGLIARVDATTLAAVLGHERAHIERGDTRWALVERVAASLLPKAVADRLLDRATLAREQASDARAAERAGGRLLMARALTGIARLGPSPAGLSIAAGDLEARVELLLSPPPAPGRSRGPLVVGALVALGLGPLHSIIEGLVTALLH